MGLRLAVTALALGLAVVACGSDHAATSSNGPSDAGDAGAVPDEKCAPGELELADGTCRAAGASASCATGFTSDGKSGCVAVLPVDPCPKGLVAYPGETACHVVAPCGDGKWGDIQGDARTQWVDGSYLGGDGDGTQAKPWQTIRAALTAAEPGAIVAVGAGTYEEFVGITKPVTLWGKCPGQVELRTPTGVPATIAVRGADGTVLRGLAVTGPEVPILISGDKDVVVQDLWVHDASTYGVAFADTWGATVASVKNVLVEGVTGDAAMLVISSQVTFEDLAVRDSSGRGIELEATARSGTSANVAVRSAIVERVADVGLFAGAATVRLDGVLVRDVQPLADGTNGRGIAIQVQDGTTPAGGPVRGNVTMRGVVIERARDIGFSVFGSDADVEGLVVRDTKPQQATQAFGRGVQIQEDEPTGQRPKVAMRSSLVEGSRECGASIAGADATIEGVIVRDTAGRPDGRFGVGVAVERDYATKPGVDDRSHVVLRGCRVERSHLVGISVIGSDVESYATYVTETLPQSDGQYGDGIAIIGGPYATSMTVHGTKVDHSSRAGLANFGATAEIARTELGCNGFDLDGERLDDVDFTYADRGGNACGCGGGSVCTVLSAQLQPPGALK